MNAVRAVIILKWLPLAALAAACNFVALRPLLDVSRHILFLDSLLSGTVLAAVSYLLRRSVPESMASLSNLHRMLYYCALGLLFVTVWLLAEAGLLEIFSSGSVAELLPAVPVKIINGMLIYMSLLLTQHRAKSNGIIETTAGEVPIEQRSESRRIVEPVIHVSVKNGAKIELIEATDIMVLEAEGDYVRIVTGNGRYMKEQTMRYFSENLSPDMFVRVHRSAIVNVKYISRIETYGKQRYITIMRNGQHISMSQNGYRLLKDTLNL